MGEARKNRDWKKSDGEDEDEEKKEDEEGAEEKEEEDTKMDDEPSAEISLSEEEKKMWYRVAANPDIEQSALAKSYASFTLPSKDEGFDEIIFAWQPQDKTETYLREWLLEQKRTQRAEELEPSKWFKDEYDSWRKVLQEWK